MKFTKLLMPRTGTSENLPFSESTILRVRLFINSRTSANANQRPELTEEPVSTCVLRQIGNATETYNNHVIRKFEMRRPRWNKGHSDNRKRESPTMRACIARRAITKGPTECPLWFTFKFIVTQLLEGNNGLHEMCERKNRKKSGTCQRAITTGAFPRCFLSFFPSTVRRGAGENAAI